MNVLKNQSNEVCINEIRIRQGLSVVLCTITWNHTDVVKYCAPLPTIYFSLIGAPYYITYAAFLKMLRQYRQLGILSYLIIINHNNLKL